MNIDNEFQWRSELRKLGGDAPSQRDLWPQIAARIAVPPTTQSWRVGLGLAAACMLAIGVAAIAWRERPRVPTLAVAPTQAMPDAVALAWVLPSDSKLAASARDLDAASAALQQAIEQHPQAVFLVGLLNRTNDQRLRLLRRAHVAG